MKAYKWQILLGFFLIVLSALFYVVHYFIFRDPHHIFIYLLGDIAFVFFEVLLVTLVIHELLSLREKRARFEKMNMVIGTFFSEVGTDLLAVFSDHDTRVGKIRDQLLMKSDWSEENFSRVTQQIAPYDPKVEILNFDLDGLRGFLSGKRDFLLRLLENPNVLEHEAFTDVLRAAFHLVEELAHREKAGDLPEADRRHLAGDMNRVYRLLLHQWLTYMKYLKKNYPYLFSLALRTNPFDRNASPIVQET